MLSIFSHVWSSVCLLWRNVCRDYVFFILVVNTQIARQVLGEWEKECSSASFKTPLPFTLAIL